MSEMNVLVSGKAVPNVKEGTFSKEENPGTESAAMEFAAIFSGWMAQAMGQGQNSGFQSSDPAGKEANSGQIGIQGLEGMLGTLRTVAGLNEVNRGSTIGTVSGVNSAATSGQEQPGKDSMIQSVRPEIMTLLSQENLFEDVADAGIGSEQLQTVKLPLSELDQYRVLISQLLEEMSGEISKVSIKPADIQGLLTQLSQQIGLNQQISVNPSQFINSQPELHKTIADTLELKAIDTQVMNSSDVHVQSEAQSKIDNKNIKSILDNNVQTIQNKGTNQSLKSDSTQPLVKTLSRAQSNIQSNGQQINENNPPVTQKEFVQDITENDIAFSGSGNMTNNYVQSPALNLSARMDSTVNLPIWHQVAQELQAKLLNQSPNVRELNIQLHPAELGQISISVTLDNGQVHLQMQASQAATAQSLQNNFPELRDALSQSGIQCGMMQMGFADQSANYNQGHNQTYHSQSKTQNIQDPEDQYQDEARQAVSAIRSSNQEIGQSYQINVTA